MDHYDAEAEISEIVDGIEDLAHGDPRLKEWQRAIDVADREKMLEDQIWLRLQYLAEADFYADGMKMLVAYPSLLKLLDEEQRTVGTTENVYHVLWDYKWLISQSQHFYQVSPEQLERMAEDFKRRLLENGYSLQPYYQEMFYYYRWLDPEKAKDFYSEYRKLPRNELSDCIACGKLKEVEYYFAAGQREEAFLCAQPILDKRMTCKEMPYGLYQVFLKDAIWQALEGVMFSQGEMEKLSFYAEQYRYACVRLEILKGKTGILFQYYCLFEPNRALGWFKKNCMFPDIWKNPEDIMEFARGAMLFFGKVIGKDHYRMIMPKEYAFYREDNQYSVSELYGHYKSMELDLVKKFEKGKHSDYYRKKHEAYIAYVEGNR